MNQFHDYDVLFNHLKSFEQRYDGWEFSHQPIEPFSFPVNKEDFLQCIEYSTDLNKIVPHLSELVSKRKSTLTESFSSSLNKEELLTILAVSIGDNGITRKLSEHYNNHMLHLRNYPSGGAMYSVKTYLYVHNVEGCKEGLYFADGEGLKLIQEIRQFDTVKELFPIEFSDQVKVTLFMIADFEYTFPKYGYLALSLSQLEAGHICQNLQLATTELKKDSLPVGGFYADRIANFLGFTHDKYKHCIYTFLIG